MTKQAGNWSLVNYQLALFKHKALLVNQGQQANK